ncbi:hypothetical protein OG530_41015 (plasmid) [Streptomyces decoyicus]|uniref:hypothetical protein n=1 Tax=Streptomyces decoyicus TaxID=249567 RepID=UPI002E16C0D4
MPTPKPNFAAIRAAAAQDRAAARAAAAQDIAKIDGQILKDSYERGGASGLTKRLEGMGRERAARAAKTLGYDYD